MEELLPRLAFDPAQLPPSGPLWLEIGFGAGEHLAWQAAQNPGVTLVGCEVYRNGIAASGGGGRKRHDNGGFRKIAERNRAGQ